MYVANKNVTIHFNGGQYNLKEGQEVKPGLYNKLPAFSKKNNVVMLPDNYLQRQLIWIKKIEKEMNILLIFSMINSIMLEYIPEDKKVGQWCVGKQNKILALVREKFGDDLEEIENTHSSGAYNWSGPVQTKVTGNEDVINAYIHLQCNLIM